MSEPDVTIIGAGLAGSEAALQLAKRGYRVRLLEQKPAQRTPAQSSGDFAEMVCSNSFRGAALTNAVGLLKEEMRRMGSEVMEAAAQTKVPAGGALAVDREKFAAEMTRRLRQHELIEIVEGEVKEIPSARPLLIATGPLTGDKLAKELEELVGGGLAYYDAIAPIIDAESINMEKAFFASRWDKGETEEEKTAYINCPFTKDEYQAFVKALVDAEKVEPNQFEKVKYFEGCLPIEVMAERGEKTLSFGPMKPSGITDPKTGRWPAAVVQLRKEDEAGTAYNLVGFQTRMKWGEQKRVLKMIPGLENAEFLRFGAVHRNTFLNAPQCVDQTWQLKSAPGVYLAGQIIGTEGYVEAAAGGWLAAHFIAARLSGVEPSLPPEHTAHAGLLRQTSRHEDDYQPSNITFAHLSPWEGPRLKKRAKYEAMAERALAALEGWQPAAVVSS
ncbi:MAG: methylenetetrahydrofolate--tRNA-(uracil(54)-C(5))-methyltransferase (FADH(2)-oxidizing) TrmFO [Polyangiaceae bacterium]|nr:methylenetetrahydrofolate--tRNA-(uracil(54)-C(5))-methyltransferase (FADH(2)-oxidizing) TrmFO [Polyangiaceae bacterium]